MHLLHIDPISTCFLEGRETASLHLLLLVWSGGFKRAKMTTEHLATAQSPLSFPGRTEESQWWLQLFWLCSHPANVIPVFSPLECLNSSKSFNINLLQLLRLMADQETQAGQWVLRFLRASFTTNTNHIGLFICLVFLLLTQNISKTAKLVFL